jgi:hypothetical protein
MIMVVGFLLKMPTPLLSSYVTEVWPMRGAIPAVGVIIGGGSFMGQFVGPLLVGCTKSMSDGYGPSFVVLGIAGILGGATLLTTRPRR